MSGLPDMIPVVSMLFASNGEFLCTFIYVSSAARNPPPPVQDIFFRNKSHRLLYPYFCVHVLEQSGIIGFIVMAVTDESVLPATRPGVARTALTSTCQSALSLHGWTYSSKH